MCSQQRWPPLTEAGLPGSVGLAEPGGAQLDHPVGERDLPAPSRRFRRQCQVERRLAERQLALRRRTSPWTAHLISRPLAGSVGSGSGTGQRVRLQSGTSPSRNARQPGPLCILSESTHCISGPTFLIDSLRDDRWHFPSPGRESAGSLRSKEPTLFLSSVDVLAAMLCGRRRDACLRQAISGITTPVMLLASLGSGRIDTRCKRVLRGAFGARQSPGKEFSRCPSELISA